MKNILILLIQSFICFPTFSQTIDDYSQWALRKPSNDPGNRIGGMDVLGAWDLGATGQNIKIAVIDQGVDLGHPDLVGNLLEGYDATKSYSGVDTKGGLGGFNYSHGTNCAGVIGAVKNGDGVVGVAYDAKIIPVKAMWATQGSTRVNRNPKWDAEAIINAVDMGADVISYSWGYSYDSDIENAFQYAWKKGRSGKGTVIVVAAGNTHDTAVPWTGTLEGTLTVGASTQDDQKKSDSRYGPYVDVYAPGINIYTTDLQGAAGESSGDYYSEFDKTSSACPNVAGVAALMLSQNSNLTFDKVIALIKTTTDPGAGIDRVNVLEAVKAAKQSTRPMVTPVSNANRYNYGYNNSEQFYVELVPGYLNGYTYHWRITSSQSCGSNSGPRFWSNGNGTTAITTTNKINVNTGNCTGTFYIYCEAVSNLGVRGYSSRRINVSNSSGGGTGDPCGLSVMAYPNPSHKRTVTISLVPPPDDCYLSAFNSKSNTGQGDELISKIEVVDVSGKLVYRVIGQNSSLELDTQNFEVGIYCLHVYTNQSKVLYQKLIKN